jgi:hypothetical protein
MDMTAEPENRPGTRTDAQEDPARSRFFSDFGVTRREPLPGLSKRRTPEIGHTERGEPDPLFPSRASFLEYPPRNSRWMRRLKEPSACD